MEFLGRPIKYWVEMQSRVETLGEADLIQEIANLRAKVSFYEGRLGQMVAFKNKVDGVHE